MEFVKKATKDNNDPASAISKVRITLSSRDPKGIEKVSESLLTNAREKNIKIKGPMRFPTKTLKITTRKTPCGNGTNTWDTYEMKIYKRVIDLYAPQEVVKQVTAINIDASVDVEVAVSDA